jgi:hypothetical protein
VLTSNGAGVAPSFQVGSSPPFADSTFIVKGSVDATKRLRFEVDGFTTEALRVLTAPNLAGSPTIMTTDGAQTVTAGVWEGTAVAATKGGTGQTGYTTGEILYASATDVLSKRTIGSPGQVLTVTGGVPVWATPGVGSSPPFTDDTQIIKNLADDSKRLTFDASLITTSTNRTLTAPNNNGTIATFPATMATGDLPYAASASTGGRLGVGGTAALLKSSGTLPAWTNTTDAGNGKMPIGNGTGFTFAVITGANNRITVTPGAGTLNITTPQDIAATSQPQFDSILLQGLTGAGPFVQFGASGPEIVAGAGSPEGVRAAPVGSLWLRTNGGAGTTLYVKESGGSGDTGWVAK